MRQRSGQVKAVVLSWVYLELFSPVLLLLPMDFHVCISTFDLVEHSEKSL